jgi:hypothetical protein
MQYRHELKHMINYQEYVLAKFRLKNLLHLDENTRSDDSYTIRSLYFDDYYNHAYHEKYAGVANRCKYRIRIYNQSERMINLERKIKKNSYSYKQVAPMTVEEVYCVLQGDYEFLLRGTHELLRVFYHECVSNIMRPRVVIDYEREAYVLDAGDVRVTFDKNVRVGMHGFDIFDDSMPMLELLPPGNLIMEVKFTEFLPTIVREVLPSKASEYTAVSKYLLGCDRTMHQRFSHI